MCQLVSSAVAENEKNKSFLSFIRKVVQCTKTTKSEYAIRKHLAVTS